MKTNVAAARYHSRILSAEYHGKTGKVKPKTAGAVCSKMTKPRLLNNLILSIDGDFYPCSKESCSIIEGGVEYMFCLEYIEKTKLNVSCNHTKSLALKYPLVLLWNSAK